MRLGIYGGSFDPVHNGHLLLAECCREQCRLDQVWFIPAHQPPHKQTAALSSGEHRTMMLRLATGGHEAFVVSTLELDRGGVSYTVDTLAAVAAAQPGADLFLLLGSDSLVDLPGWHEPQRICEWALPVAVGRGGGPPADFSGLASFMSPERLALAQSSQVDMPAVDLSASDIRRRVAAGLSIRYRTPRAVERYIQTHGLYR